MDGSIPIQLPRKDGSTALIDQDLFGPPGSDLVVPAPQTIPMPTRAEDVAGRLYACESLTGPPKAGSAKEEGEPYTLQWFLSMENHRHGKHARWIPRLLEFAKHQGETLLGLGHGLGTDWLQYGRNGASVIVCSSCNSQLELIRSNFQLRGLGGRFVHALPWCLPLQKSSVDVVCISGLLQDVADPGAVVEEVFRVLKPGGKVIAVTPAKYDVDYWRRKVFFWESWLGIKTKPTENLERRFSASRLRRLFQGFDIHRVYKRHLRRSEVPHLWRLWPLPLLERLMGRVLVVKAFKPVSMAMMAQAA